MLGKIVGALLLTAGVIVGIITLVALVGTALSILWMAVKVAIPVALVYFGYRMLIADRAQLV